MTVYYDADNYAFTTKGRNGLPICRMTAAEAKAVNAEIREITRPDNELRVLRIVEGILSEIRGVSSRLKGGAA